MRRQTGYDLDLDGFDTDHITFGVEVLYRNPYQGQRWNDEEIAIATLLEDMAAWAAATGPRRTRSPTAATTTAWHWRSRRRPTGAGSFRWRRSPGTDG